MFVHIRSSIKFIFLIVIAAVIIISAISLFYKMTYSVTLNGEFIGYTTNKSALQKQINEYMEKGENASTAFVDIENLPAYSLCFLKKDAKTNDKEIFEKVKALGTPYYEYYAIVEKNEEKYYVATREEAEAIIDELKSKNSNNIKNLAYTQIYGTELKSFEEKDKIVTALYVKKVQTYSSYTMASAETKLDLGIGLIKPVSSGYTITSRYGARSRGQHTGLDIAAPTGTNIVAAAGGTVQLAGNYGNGYGNYIIISHGNGIQTLYGHCSAVYVTEGQTVSQGQSIGAVGSTGNSTGSHLHLEVRVNGTTLNPQNYLY